MRQTHIRTWNTGQAGEAKQSSLETRNACGVLDKHVQCRDFDAQCTSSPRIITGKIWMLIRDPA